MSGNLLTIVTRIKQGEERTLREFLRTHADPRYDAQTLLRCKPKFQFHQLAGLHFCSFVILGADRSFDPCLVFEATFDGPKTDFIRALLQIAGPGMHEVYQHCEGYPVSGQILPNVTEEYLLKHDVGAHAFFSGCPARPVGQIVAENRLRCDVVAHLAQMRRRLGTTPATLNSVRGQLQEELICHRSRRRWAEQVAPVPGVVAFGRLWLVLGGLALLGLLSALVAIVLWLALGLSVGDVYSKIEHWYRYGDLLNPLIEGGPSSLQWLKVPPEHDAAVRLALIALLVLWFVLRFIELICFPLSEDPSDQSFLLRYARWVLFVLRYGVLIFLIGFAIIALAPGAQKSFEIEVDGGSRTLQTIIKKDLNLAVSWWRTLAVLASCAFFLALLRHWATSLMLAVEFQQLTQRKENVRRFFLDILGLGMLVTAWLVALALVAHVPDKFMQHVMGYVGPTVNGALVVAFYVLVTLLLLLALIAIIALAVRVLELSDKRRYKSARNLTNSVLNNTSAYAREEVGINAHQNHLASVTHVKSGLMRRWLLFTSLWVVNLLARLWFNHGDLGGIPTILSARWVMIDDGRRLLFLDNYGGAWESYLNQFIDLSAVIGLNAIWANTFITAGPEKEPVGFPETKFLLWGGAQAEKPFKAYVRQSQVETIVWYSAYPTLSIININTNTDLRQSLFKLGASSDLDAFFQKL